MNILGLMGKARSGKDTLAQMVISLRPHTDAIAFADPIKSFCKEVYDWTDEHVYGELKDKPDERYPRPHDYQDPTGTGSVFCQRCREPYDVTANEACSYLTPREAMQQLGTEWGRQCWPQTWVELAFRRAEKLLAASRVKPKPAPSEGSFGTTGEGSCIVEWTDLVVITDVRFVNEAKAIKEAGGLVWQISRPVKPTLTGDAATHLSETQQDEAATYVDLHIMNDGTLDQLEKKAAVALQQAGLYAVTR